MQAISLYDEVGVTFEEPGGGGAGGFFVGLRCSDSAVPVDGTNLASRAAYLLRESVDAELTGVVEIDLVKRIPMAAGLAGGIADAAAVLLALARLWNLRAGVSELAALGRRLGADVPFCVHACAAVSPGAAPLASSPVPTTAMLAEGVGERLAPAAGAAPGSPVLLVKPDVEVSTAGVYGAFDAAAPGGDLRAPGAPDAQAALRGQPCGNDLQPVTAALHPVVADTLAALCEICGTAAKVQMSGSGPTVGLRYSKTGRARGRGRRTKRRRRRSPGCACYSRRRSKRTNPISV